MGLDASPFLASIPFDAPRRRTTRDAWSDVKSGLDFVAHNLPRAHRILVRLNPYPKPWRAVRVQMPDGARLSAWHAAGRPDSPRVLMLPGTFQTKDDTARKRRAIDLWRRLGAHVLILDQRGFGGSSAFPGAAGYLESSDAHAAADWLRAEAGAERVTLWGESLGGAVALLAASRPGARERFERVLAWSPFADLDDATRASDTGDPRGRTLLGSTYRWLLRRRTQNAVGDFREYLALRAAELGLTLDALVEAGSPLRHVAKLEAPAFVFHAEDDRVVPVEHARRLAESGAPNLHVELLPRGAHLDFDRVAPSWYSGVTARIVANQTTTAA